jgi:hypothetical protein
VPDSLAPEQPVRASTIDSPGPADGYGLKPAKGYSPRKKRGRRHPSDITPSRVGFVERKEATSMAGGVLAPLKTTEKSWFASILYPLRSADSLAVIASLTAILWLFTILVPEYCIELMSEADDLGKDLLGQLLALITILPVAFLLPFAVFYWLQYLGRVVVSSGMGDTTPPRTPDRNFEGFFSGLSPWLSWLFLGLGVGLLPAALVRVLWNSAGPGSAMMELAFVCVGLPYILAALLMTFLHDDDLAARPLRVLTALFQLGSSFLFLCVFVAFLVGAAAGTFMLAFLLRDGYFKTYLLACVACWAAFVWTTIVVMRVLGSHYHPRRQILGWTHDRPRWGVAWKL